MRASLLIVIAVLVLAIFIVYGLFVLLRSIFAFFAERKDVRQNQQLSAEYAERRRQRDKELAKRLENGCEHDFVDPLRIFPPGVCVHCGLAEKRPAGKCDHVWRRDPGGAPASRCEKCGEQFGSSAWS